jgi:hypothetical protein
MAKISSNQFIQSFFIFLVCAAGILVFIVLIILPSKKTAAELDRDIEELSARIEEQRILTPVFHSLLKRAKIEAPSGLPATEKAKLTYGDMNAISTLFQEISQRHNLKLEEITTDVSSLKEGSEYLVMRLRLTGDFFNFREFLIDLGSIPSLEHVEEIKIRSIQAARELRLKLWLAQE